jgi:hypothetical protein
MRSSQIVRSVAEFSRRSSVLALFLIAASCAAPREQKSEAAAATPKVEAPKIAEQKPAGQKPAAAKSAAPTALVAKSGDVAQGPAIVQRLTDLGKNDNHVQEHLEHLTKSIGPRLTGSSNLKRAQDWAVGQFQSFGLEAHLEQWGEFPVGFDRGPSHGGMVAPEKRDYTFITSAWTPGTSGAARGPALKFPTTDDELAALKGKLKNAWLVRSTSSQQPKQDFIDGVRKAMLDEGAFGEIRAGRGDLLLMSGNYNIKWDELPKRISITLRNDDHKDLTDRLDKGDAVELEFNVDNRFVKGPIPQYNVVAELKGSTKPDEYLIVCGHLDSWDGAEGAVDNGTGCATTIEVARLLTAAGAKPERSIRFVLWSGEEQGLFGSEGYVRDHKADLDKITTVLNHDEGTDYLSGLTITHEMEAAMTTACASLNDLDPAMPFKLDVGDDLKSSPDSDHWPFVKAGVPAFFWKQSGGADYNHCHHTQYDTFDAANADYQKHSATVAAIAAYNIANLPAKLDRTNIAPLEPRRMGVDLDKLQVTSVIKEGRAAAAGWQVGDEIVSIDGVVVKSRIDISQELQKGGPKKNVLIKRGDKEVQTVLDYSDDPAEPRRAAAAEKKAKKDAEKAAEKAKKEADKATEPKKDTKG